MPAAERLALARQDERVARALEIAGQQEVRWTDLYHLFEIVQSDVGRGIYDGGWVTQAAVTRFRRTANSPGILGAAARHGSQRTDPPPDPISYEDARALILGLLVRWLDSKIAPVAEAG